MVEQKFCCDIFSHSESYIFIDVRSPSEFACGHIPGAHNIPLFSDDIRALVGTCYVQQGRGSAIHLAMQKIGPNLNQLVVQAQQVINNKILCVYCARGGMRSASVSWLFALFKLPVVQLSGGYKAFRNWTLAQFETKQMLQVLGGKTGSGKTEYLKYLAQTGDQVIDLEKLARHKGSVFGGDKRNQATQQQFENDLALIWIQLDTKSSVWIEDESRKIGSVIIPEPVWLLMRQAPVYVLLSKRTERVARIMCEYGSLDRDFVLQALAEIKDHLGFELYQSIYRAYQDKNYLFAVDTLLMYYDKKYAHGFLHKKCAGCFAFFPELPKKSIFKRSILALSSLFLFG